MSFSISFSARHILNLQEIHSENLKCRRFNIRFVSLTSLTQVMPFNLGFECIRVHPRSLLCLLFRFWGIMKSPQAAQGSN